MMQQQKKQPIIPYANIQIQLSVGVDRGEGNNFVWDYKITSKINNCVKTINLLKKNLRNASN